ncbi:hypothetical protein ELH22_05960 [Rhizobium ruizarguesonis]|uniref:hypothetical protein n=1 Tax=Rhizobium ruizarguesonis TaxID=2081791 RepID=UPI00102F3701|nr:hypothetical protein [Rhizobium ruizarguesonis]TBA20460.1 hypothetical protein ELH66_05365 [Rhizobium ruizarguesonis]TBD62903.1 hypothetical protein ELH22_05960 [Rhizobium ruizarguesonis]
MNTRPTLELLNLVITRMRDRLAARDALLAAWFVETMAVMETRFSEAQDDPLDLAPARAAALAFVKAALHQWATRPPHERQPKTMPGNSKARRGPKC